MDSKRRTGLGLVVAIVLAALVAAPVSAKPRDISTRIVDFGSSQDGTLDVSPSQVYPGGFVDFTAVATNRGSQTLTHATFGLGNQAALPGPGGPSLPSGWTIVSITPSVGSCTWDANGAMCSFGSLAGRGGSASVYVLINAGTAGSGIWASLKIAEQVNDNGANTDTFYASSTVSAAAQCNTPALSKLPGNVAVHLEYNTSSCTATQSSKADLKAAAFTTGALAQTASGPNCRPGGGAECFGVFTSIDIPEVPGGAVVTWTVTWDVTTLSKNFKLDRLGVIHYPDHGAAVKILAPNACDTADELNCTVSFGYINGGTQLEMVFKTPENGVAKGFG